MSDLTHVDEHGRARMVDVGAKPETARTATAVGKVTMQPDTLTRIREGGIAKGDVLAVAQVAAVQAAKRTSDLIPMCHPLRLTGVDVDFDFEDDTTLSVSVTVRALDRTGVEMEAMTAAAVAGLTVYDMAKAIDRSMTVGPVKLVHKAGGKTGEYRRDD
jgi:cyclic pyranopterin phosphate synthase